MFDLIYYPYNKADERGGFMVWHEAYPADRQPDMEEIDSFVGSPYWKSLCTYVERNYLVTPRIEFSRCTMQTGWNVKYKKSSRAICTLYPEQGKFICMISIGAKEATEAELVLKGCTAYLRQLYERCTPFNGGRWLMIEVTSEEILEDVKELIGVRMKTKR